MNFRFFYVSVFIMMSCQLLSQNVSQDYFTQVSLPVYTSNTFVNDILKDNNQMLWLATNGGLIRYSNSNTVRVYDKENTDGISSDHIEKVYQDSRQNIWIGTRHGGLSRFSPVDGKWVNYLHDINDKASLCHDEVLTICEDYKGRIWAGTENGVSVYNYETDSFINFYHDPSSKSSLSSKATINIYEDKFDNIWICTWTGDLNIFKENSVDFGASTFQRISIDNGKPNKESIWCIYEEPNTNRYWAGSHYSGLFLFSLEEADIELAIQEGRLDFTAQYLHDPNDGKSLSTSIHLGDIQLDADGNLLIATSNGISEIKSSDLSKLGKGNSKLNFKSYMPSHLLKRSLPSDEIQCFYLDNQDILWVGTDQGMAIRKGNQGFLSSQLVKPLNGKPTTISDLFLYNATELILAFSDNEFGIAQGELGIYNLLDDSYSLINEVYPFVPKIEDLKYMKDLAPDKLLLVRSSGIQLLDFSNKKLEDYKLTPSILEALNSYIVHAVLFDDLGRMWIGLDGRLFIIDKDGVVIHDSIIDEFNIPTDVSVTQMVKDKNGQIWVSTYNGLYRFNYQDSISVKEYSVLDESLELPTNRIIDLAYCDDKLFIATPLGVFRFDEEAQNFIKIGAQVENESYYRIIAGAGKDLWARSKDKLFYYNIETDMFIVLRNISGYHGSLHASDDERLWAGGRTGFVYFDYKDMQSTISKPQALISELTLYSGDGAEMINTISRTNIDIEPSVNRFEVSFCSDNFLDFEYNRYAYRMVGFDDNWTYTNSVEPISYTNLNIGSYTFEVKTKNSIGQWSDQSSSIDIRLLPAVWETNWFKLLLLICSLLFIYLLFKLYNKRVVKANLILKNEISKRVLTEDKLKNVNDQLKHSNKELEHFAFVASHDLKEPLRTIGAFSSLLNQKYGTNLDDSGKEYLGHISQGVQRMYSLIESLLSYSANKEEDLNIEECELSVIVDNVKSDLFDYIENKNAVVEANTLPIINVDKIQLHMVLSNLIKNAIKFNESGQPKVNLYCSSQTENDITVAINDNGIGIPSDKFEDIFLIFKRLHNKSVYEGSGIGLALCNKIIERHNGTISVSSQEGEGTTFFITLPR